MRIFISADMEGATGVTSIAQCDSRRPEYAFGCRMQQRDVLAAVRGALDGGADEVIVNDAHSHMTNLDIGEWPKGARLTSGSPPVRRTRRMPSPATKRTKRAISSALSSSSCARGATPSAGMQ